MQPPKDYDPDYHVKNSDFKKEYTFKYTFKHALKCIFSLETLIMIAIMTGSFCIGIEILRTFSGAQ
jgi:hypothetical protein